MLVKSKIWVSFFFFFFFIFKMISMRTAWCWCARFSIHMVSLNCRNWLLICCCIWRSDSFPSSFPQRQGKDFLCIVSTCFCVTLDQFCSIIPCTFSMIPSNQRPKLCLQCILFTGGANAEQLGSKGNQLKKISALVQMSNYDLWISSLYICVLFLFFFLIVYSFACTP